jgi:phosphoserine phosphatase RsbU/P
MKFRKIILTAISVIIFLQIFLMDIIRKVHDPVEMDSIKIRQVLIVFGFSIIFYLLNKSEQKKEKPIVVKIGNILLTSAGVLVALASVTFMPVIQFTQSNTSLIPENYFTVIIADLFSFIIAFLSLYLLIMIKNFIFSYRRKDTKRNFIILLLLLFLTVIYDFLFISFNEIGYGFNLLLVATVIFILINSFRLPWIAYLAKKEKYYIIAYSLFLLPLIILATVINGLYLVDNPSSMMLFYFSPIIKEFVFFITLFTSIYFGIAFISTIFHIPTQDIFDRKIVEISSLHNLSRLVTQVFDFRDLIENITKLSLGITEANCAWIYIKKEVKELPFTNANINKYGYELAGFNSITAQEIEIINSSQAVPFEEQIAKDRKIIYINDLALLKTIKSKELIIKKIRSLVVIPLISHSEIIGILYIGKSFAFGFDKEYLNIIGTFADQATISIENSKLIEKSIEKERMERELLLAQKMQRKLLPLDFPTYDSFDLCAISIPAYEVGGDYYDFSRISETKIGVIVGDVSGKGISAAFYMAVLKGVFQALSKVYTSPKDFLSKANLSLIGHIEKKSFVSLIYGILDFETGKLYLSRAGHCPMVYVTENEASYIKPEGLGVGLDNGKIFDNITEEIEIQLQRNSVCVFYTDGMPEARNKNGEEYGYDRLINSVVQAKDRPATGICDKIMSDLKEFTQNDNEFDDLTLVIIKWKG